MLGIGETVRKKTDKVLVVLELILSERKIKQRLL